MALLVAALVTASCTSGDRPAGRREPSHTPSHTRPPSSTPATTPTPTPERAGTGLESWPTYHHTADRAGHVAHAPRGPLQRSWRTRLRGGVYGEPLVVGRTLVVATQRNYVYGLAPRTGARRWRVHLGTAQRLRDLPCGDIGPLGVISTPTYSRAENSVFVAAETAGGVHTLWALDPATGARRWHRNLDTQPNRSRLAEQQRSALNIIGGRVVTTFGGLAGDCSDYVGYATAVRTDGTGPVESYAVPTAREAGMWAPPGPVRGPNGHVYVASGNGAELHGRWDGSDSVTELTSSMRRLSVFAPATWRSDNIGDLDLGSSSPAVVPSLHRLVIAGKRGVVYLLPLRLGGVGSALDHIAGCQAFGGAAVAGRTVVMPCKGEYSLRALHVGAHSLRWSWQRSGVYSSPVVAGHKVYAADQRSGDLVVMSLATGRPLRRYPAGPMPHFPSEVVSGDWVFVPTLSGVTAFRGR
jgi:outer membrane protein assembly factor BamB